MAWLEHQPRPVRAGGDVPDPDVSLIIPARNEERWLSATLDAAILAVAHHRQRIAPGDRSAEIIVVDNWSTDGTWELLLRYAARHRIRPVQFETLGCARA